MIGIYIIENKINHKQYIGKSINVDARWKEHKYMYKKKNTKLYAAIRKHELSNFSFSILKECKEEELNHLERYYINLYDTLNTGYNLTAGGDGGNTYTWTKKQRVRQSKNTTLINHCDNRLGAINTKQHNERISKARLRTNGMRGKKHTEERNLKLSKKLKYNTYNVKIIKLINLKTNETLEFKGLTAAEEYTGIKRGTIWHRIKFNVVKDNLKFQYKTP